MNFNEINSFIEDNKPELKFIRKNEKKRFDSKRFFIGNEWISDYNIGLNLAKEQKKYIILFFNGWTCTNCRYLEENILSSKEVIDIMKDMVKVYLYVDRRREPENTNRKLQKDKFNKDFMPYFVILDSKGNKKNDFVFTRNKQEFIDFLKKGIK